MRGSRALAGIMVAAAAALAAGAATAQVPYQIGDDRHDVTVDFGVLESLGPAPTVPEMLRPGTPVGELGYDPRVGALAAIQPPQRGGYSAGRAGMPAMAGGYAPAPNWLRRPDAPRYAPLPSSLGRPAAPQAAAPALTRPTLTPPSAARPAATAPKLHPPTAPATRTEAPSAPPRPKMPDAMAEKPAARTTVTAPPPPKPAAPAVTAEAKPRTPDVKAPQPPRAPPPPALPAAAAPAKTPPAAPAKETQVAAATTGPAPSAPPPAASDQGAGGEVVRVPFEANQSALPASATGGLDALIAKLRKDDTLRVQLLAYADGDEDNANKARRLSLSRALAVRAYLIDKQIQSTRMDVRALGNRTKEAPKDRVDVVLVSR